MKKIILFFAFLPMLAMAQNEVVNEICGVKFGASYNQVKEVVVNRFGTPILVSEETILFDHNTYGGLSFDAIFFRFNSSCLDMVNFGVWGYTTKEAAIQERDKIANWLKRKYSLKTKINEDGETVYFGGVSPKRNGDSAFKLLVTTSSGRDGSLLYNVDLVYGPYGYGDEF